MEESGSGGYGSHEKKYILYTVGGGGSSDKGCVSCSVWVVRIVLGVLLLLIALVVVAFIVLRLAEAGDRTVIVFQPLPVHKITNDTILKSIFVEHSSKVASPSSENQPSFRSATTIREARTISALEDSSNSSIFLLREAVVTMSIQDEVDNVSQGSGIKNYSDEEPIQERRYNASDEYYSNNSKNTIPSDTPSVSKDPTNLEMEKNISETSEVVSVDSIFVEFSNETASSFSTKGPKIIHKLAYLAASASGTHMGGICVFKTNGNVTQWYYFYENLPIEFQSNDSTDIEMRSILAGVRLCSKDWDDYHVIVISHHNAIKRSKHPTRKFLDEELKERSGEHFTYEMELRARHGDSLMNISYCLARLNKKYNHYFRCFEKEIVGLFGEQKWKLVKSSNRLAIPQNFFATSTRPIGLEGLRISSPLD